MGQQLLDYNDLSDENIDRLPNKTNFVTSFELAARYFLKTYKVSARFKNKITKQYETKYTDKYKFNIRKLITEPIKVLDIDHNHLTSYIDDLKYKAIKIAEAQAIDTQKHIVDLEPLTNVDADIISSLVYMQKILYYLEGNRVYLFNTIMREAVLSVLKEEFPDITTSAEWDDIEKVHIAIKNFPVELDIFQIKSDLFARGTSIKGTLVSYDNSVRVDILQTAWQCANCEQVVEVRGARQPIKCSNCKENRPGFTEVPELQKTTDFIYIKIQQQFNTDQTQIGLIDMPVKIQGKHLIDYFYSKMKPAANLKITGVVELGGEENTRAANPNERTIVINALGIDVEGESNVIEYNDRLLDVVKKVDTSFIGEHYAKLIRSIAPHLYKQEMIKTGIAMMYVGSDPIIRGSGTRIRGDIVVMLVGDPAHGKSDYGIYTLKVLPQSIRTIGGSSTTSKVGLTTAVEIVNNVKRISFGVLPLCDLRGVAIIDELDKRSKEEFEVLSIPLDDNQKIPTHKSGFHHDVNARCPVLLIGNPSKNGGKWDNTKSIYEQTNFAAWLMSRADIVFVMYDDGDMERHAATLEHIEQMDSASVFESDYENNRKNKLYTELNIDKIEADILSNKFDGYYDAEYIRHEIHYLKTNYKPVLKPNTAAYNKLKKEWLKLKQINVTENYEDGQSVTNNLMDARKFNSLRRLACACARLHRRNVVTEEDVQIAVDLMLYSFAALMPHAKKDSLSQGTTDLSALLSDRTMNKLEKDFVLKLVKDRDAYIKSWISRLTSFNRFIAARSLEKCKNCLGRGDVPKAFAGTPQESQQCITCKGEGYFRNVFGYNDLEADVVNKKLMSGYECRTLFHQYIAAGMVTGGRSGSYKPAYPMDSVEVKTIVQKMAETMGERWFQSEMQRKHGLSGTSGFDK